MNNIHKIAALAALVAVPAIVSSCADDVVDSTATKAVKNYNENFNEFAAAMKDCNKENAPECAKRIAKSAKAMKRLAASYSKLSDAQKQRVHKIIEADAKAKKGASPLQAVALKLRVENEKFYKCKELKKSIEEFEAALKQMEL